VLALGMLTCIRKSFDLLRQHRLGDYRLTHVPAGGSGHLSHAARGDIGTFQVESRAQMAMLPDAARQTL
jgi:error-prone DNA polymerase